MVACAVLRIMIMLTIMKEKYNNGLPFVWVDSVISSSKWRFQNWSDVNHSAPVFHKMVFYVYFRKQVNISFECMKRSLSRRLTIS